MGKQRLAISGMLVFMLLAGCRPNKASQEIAFDHYIDRDGEYGDDQIYTVKLNGNDLKQLTDIRGSNTDPAWSPDGKQIAFISNFEIQIMNADGSGEHRFTEGIFSEFHPDWSPDGEWIVFVRRLYEGFELFKKNVVTGQLVQLTDTPDLGETNPSWSPDGDRIAYSTIVKDAQQNYGLDIYIMDRNGNNMELITGEIKNVDFPIWGPNGNEIYFVSFESREILQYDLDSGETRQITFDGQEKDKFVITTDGSGFIFETTVELGPTEYGGTYVRPAIFTVNLDGTGLMEVPIGISAGGVALRP